MVFLKHSTNTMILFNPRIQFQRSFIICTLVQSYLEIIQDLNDSEPEQQSAIFKNFHSFFTSSLRTRKDSGLSLSLRPLNKLFVFDMPSFA